MKYNRLMRLMHWVFSLLIIGMLGIGFYMTSLDVTDPDKFEFYGRHKSIGVLILLLIPIRIIIRFASKIPALPKEISPFNQFLSKLGFLSLYICMIMFPLSGYLMSNAAGHPVQFFGIALPDIIERNLDLAGIFRQMHSNLGYILIVMILGHILFSLKHLYIDKVNLFKRII